MHLQTSQMRFLVIIVAALMILGLAAFGLVLAQKRLIPTATTAHIAPATPEASALPARAPVGQTAQATGSEASATRMQAPPAAATATPNVKDLNSSSVSMTMVHETTRLKIDASGWRQKLQDIELDLKKNQQDVEATGKDIDECLVVMRAAAGRLAPDAEIRVAFRCGSRPCNPRRGAFRPGDSQTGRIFSAKEQRIARSQPLS